MTKVVTDENFEETITNPFVLLCFSGRLDSVSLYTSGPIIDQIAEEFRDKPICIGKLYVDDNNISPVKCGIRHVPTVLFFKNGELVDRIVGACGKNKYVETIEKHMS
jgi:thioredoxin 1